MILVNIRGAKQGIIIVKVITIIKILPLIALVLLGAGLIKGNNLHWDTMPAFQTFGSAMLVLFFAFAGFETCLGASGEIKDPKRTIPWGILIGGAAVLVLYMLLQTVTQGVLGSQLAQFKDAPLAAVAERIVGAKGATVLLLAAAISCFGSVFMDILATPRSLFAMSNDGMLPALFGKVHSRYATPFWAILFYGGGIFLFSISGGFKQLASLASAAILLIYLAVVLSTIKLRMKKELKDRSFRAPGGWITPLIGIATICWLLTSLSRTELLSTLLFIVVVIVIYYIFNFLKKPSLTIEIKN
jgi:amino acid transporter